MSETQKQAIEKKSNTSVATMFEADSFAGLKNVKSESVALPILKLLQNGSGAGIAVEPVAGVYRPPHRDV